MTPRMRTYQDWPDRGSLSLMVDTDAGTVQVLVTQTTPGSSIDPDGPAQPVLVVYGSGSDPIVRVALRDRLVTQGWEPFPAPAVAPVTETEQRMLHGDR